MVAHEGVHRDIGDQRSGQQCRARGECRHPPGEYSVESEIEESDPRQRDEHRPDGAGLPERWSVGGTVGVQHATDGVEGQPADGGAQAPISAETQLPGPARFNDLRPGGGFELF